MRDKATAKIKSLILKTPILGWLAVRGRQALRRSSRSKRDARPPYAFERLELDATLNDNERARRQLLNVLNYTKTSGASYSAQRYSAGYHTIEINGERVQGQRDPAARLASVPVDFRGTTVLDIGCNQGGMLFELAGRIKWGVGIDYDSRMVNAANRIKAVRQISDVHFYVFDLQKEPLDLIKDFIPSQKVDLVFLLAVCGWLDNWREVINFSAGISDAMLFETTGSAEQQSLHEAHLRSLYRSVVLVASASQDDPKQKKRRLLYCAALSQ